MDEVSRSILGGGAVEGPEILNIPPRINDEFSRMNLPDSVKAAYAKRAQLIERTVGEIRALHAADKSIDQKVRILKALVETDPTVYKEHTTWLKLLAQPTTGDILEGHHIRGLDVNYNFMRGMSDLEMYEHHLASAERGHYWGNHPKNIWGFTKDQHVGRAANLTPARQTIHGRTAFTRLNAEQYSDWLYMQTGAIPYEDIGSPDVFGGSGSVRFSESIDMFDTDKPGFAGLEKKGLSLQEQQWYQADSDVKQIAEVEKTPRKPRIFERSHEVPKSIKDQIINKIDTDEMSEELFTAVKNKDWKTARILAKTEVPIYESKIKALRLQGIPDQGLKVGTVGGNDVVMKQGEQYVRKFGKLIPFSKYAKYGLGALSVFATGAGAIAAEQRAREDPTLENKAIAKARALEAGLDTFGAGATSTIVGAPVGAAAEVLSMAVGAGTDIYEGAVRGNVVEIEDPLGKNKEKLSITNPESPTTPP